MATAEKLMTAEEFLALPDDGTERALIDGQLRVYGDGIVMTFRNRWHSRVVTRLAYLLTAWIEACAVRPGDVFSGDVGCRLSQLPDSIVGIDVAFFSQETLDRQSGNSTIIEGPPVLAIEVLSPSDKQQEISEKIDKYLQAGTSLVWIVDPKFHTVTVYRSDAPPQLFNTSQRIVAGPQLAGFELAVAKLFD